MPPRKRADQETGSGLRRRTRGGGGQKSSKASTTDVAPVGKGGQSVYEEESVGDINCNKKDNSLLTAPGNKKGKFDFQEKSTKNGEGTKDVGHSVRNRKKLATSKTTPEGNAETKTNGRKRKLHTADIKDGPRPGKERKRQDNLNGMGSTEVQKKVTAGRSKKTNKASKHNDNGSLVKKELSENLILGAGAILEKTDIDCEDVGVMSSSDEDENDDDDDDDDDDDFEPVVKKMKSPVIKGSDKVRSARGKKVKGNISLSGSEEVKVKPKNTPARKKQRTKVEETKQEGDTKISQKSKTTKTRKKISKKPSSNSLESESVLIEKTFDNNDHKNSEKATPCQADLKKIDQSDVMSVLLHMEGGSERPGPSGLSLGEEGSEGESDGGSEEESDWEEVKGHLSFLHCICLICTTDFNVKILFDC